MAGYLPAVPGEKASTVISLPLLLKTHPSRRSRPARRDHAQHRDRDDGERSETDPEARPSVSGVRGTLLPDQGRRATRLECCESKPTTTLLESGRTPQSTWRSLRVHRNPAPPRGRSHRGQTDYQVNSPRLAITPDSFYRGRTHHQVIQSGTISPTITPPTTSPRVNNGRDDICRRSPD